MTSKKLLTTGLVLTGVGAAAAGLYRATHPADARWPDQEGAPVRRRSIDPERFTLPSDVVHHDLPTPDGGSLHVVETGRGRPLVLLHGVTLRSDVWSPQLRDLAQDFRVIAVDLRGHGRSTAGTDGYGMHPLADDLATVLTSLDLTDAILVGHSMGGMTAMTFCGDHPDVLGERVAGLVFVATRAHQVLPPYVDRGARRLVDLGQDRLDGGGKLPARSMAATRLARLAFGDRPPAAAVAQVAEMGQSMDPASMVSSLSGLLDLDARQAMADTNTPSLVIVGTRDLLTPVPAGRHLAHLLPDADLVVLARCGHQVMQERPDELAELLRAFADTIAGETPSVAAAVDADPGPVTGEMVEQQLGRPIEPTA